EQVFSNLIGNSAKYSEKHTEIKVTSIIEGDFVVISVKDQGIGMSPDNIKSVFNKFFRASNVLNTHSGLGMGLFITSKIITGHGGEIWAESEEGIGSTFYFKLPVSNIRDSVKN
ncbi:ATP-binding protein, partial [Pseudoxanthomonas sp. SGD-10]